MDVFITLTINGIATGMLIFLLAAGLSLIFGLMKVMNFAHGSFFMLGAYMGTWCYVSSGSFLLSIVLGVISGAVVGLIVERLVISRVYNNHLGQVLITVGVMMLLNELIKVVWGPNVIASPVPPALSGLLEVGGISISIYKLFIIAFALSVTLLVNLILNRSRLGMIIRAGTQNPEMVKALGIRIESFFSLVFLFGTALAALGGVLMGPAQNQVGSYYQQYMMLGFIVVVIGGMGSFTGAMLSGILIGLVSNYVAWVFPEAAMAVNVLLMAVILLIKPEGLFSVGGEA